MTRKQQNGRAARIFPCPSKPPQALLERIVQVWAPKEIWLFGSRARDDARPDSDWDLLVVVPDSTDEAKVDAVAAWKLIRDLYTPLTSFQ